MLTYGSLFSGIGCFDLAACRAGWKPLWQCEIDAQCRRVLAHHWPDVLRFDDITRIDPAMLPPVDLIIGGFPCQSLSVAGKRGGLKDEKKSGLFWQMSRIIEAVKPALVLWENVPGLLTGSDDDADSEVDGDGGTGGESGGSVPWMSAILGEFRRIGYRHGVWRTVDGLYWVPQRRRRVFGLFACRSPRNGNRLAQPQPWQEPGGLDRLLAEVLLEQGSGGRDSTSRRKPEPTIARTAGRRAGSDRGTVGVMEFQRIGSASWRQGNLSLASSDDNGSNQLIVQGFNVIGLAQQGSNHAYPANSTGAIQHKGNYPTGNEAGTVIVHAISFQERGRPGGRTLESIDNEAYALTAPAGGGRVQERNIAYAFHLTQDPIGGDVSPCRGTGNSTGCASIGVILSDGTHAVCRRLTPTECLRLQGLPDNWLDLGDGGKPISDSKKYHMIGNGGVVPCVQWILDRLRVALTREGSDNGE